MSQKSKAVSDFFESLNRGRKDPSIELTTQFLISDGTPPFCFENHNLAGGGDDFSRRNVYL